VTAVNTGGPALRLDDDGEPVGAPIPPGEVLWHLPALFRGSYRSARIRDFLCDKVTLYLDRESALQVGGDLCGKVRSVAIGLAARPIFVVS
jgi:hypothetical protein